MIAGLPWESWLLLVAAGGVGLAIELAFVRNQLRRRRTAAARSSAAPRSSAGAPSSAAPPSSPERSGPDDW